MRHRRFAVTCLVLISLTAFDAAAPHAVAQQSAGHAMHPPFPQNRVRDFYFHQAEQALSSGQPIPDLLPQFPGLDGGFFGHWGQNSEESSIDTTLESVDSGNVICNLIHHFGSRTQKGVAVRLGDPDRQLAVVFDPERLTFTDAWRDRFLSWGSGRFGIMGGATAAGTRWIDMSDCRWRLPQDTKTAYHGYFRSRTNIVFRYQIAECVVLDRVTTDGDRLVRSLELTGPVPAGTQLQLISKVTAVTGGGRNGRGAVTTVTVEGRPVRVSIPVLPSDAQLAATDAAVTLMLPAGEITAPIHVQMESIDATDDAKHNGNWPAPSAFTEPTVGQWIDQTVTTVGRLGDESGAYAIDTLTIPYVDANPFRMPMRLTGVGVMPDGRIAVSTLQGDVWMVGGADNDLRQLTWQRYAAGLYQPLGLVVQEGKVLVVGKDQVTRLHDNNHDGEADFYECVTNQYPSTGGHDFATDLHQDDAGRLYWATASGDFGLTRMEPGGVPESLSNGLRNSNGVGVSPDGRIILASVQEGSWTAATAIFDVRKGRYFGHPGLREGHGKYGYDLPMCFIPRGIDNSAGGMIFLPDDQRLGPLAGQIVGTSYGYCTAYTILREEVNGAAQGGVCPLPGEFLSGVCRMAFNPHDGHLYAAGTEGWQSYAAENGCLQRLRYTGKSMPRLIHSEARENGLVVQFNAEIDPTSVNSANVFCQQWNYLYSGAYGSPEYSVKDPGRQSHDYVPIQSVHLLPDRRSVFVEIPQLHPVMQFHLHMRLKTTTGEFFTPDAYLSIFELGRAFKDFPEYQLIAKRPWSDFPIPEKFAQDPRLVAQDSFGTNFGWVSSATRLTLTAVPGLQYEPRRLRIAPGTRVALTFHNADPSMPHNVVVVKADQMEQFGEKSMVLASNPRAIATHYVPDDPAEICFAPILNPNDQYTVYFEAPQEPGEYRFLCTYPGHWRVMRGSLFVIPDDQPLPELPPDQQSRRFVRQWTMEDLGNDANDLQNRSVQKGKEVFTLGGCIKCHRMGPDGATIGPDLSKIHERFKGTKLLQQVLDPSIEINKQYQTWLAVMQDGRVITGLLQNQTDDQVTLLPNPLKPDETVTLSRQEIEEFEPSRQSTMPTGLMMTFTKEEILDLLSYLEAGAMQAP